MNIKKLQTLKIARLKSKVEELKASRQQRDLELFEQIHIAISPLLNACSASKYETVGELRAAKQMAEDIKLTIRMLARKVV